ncbi:hypothetical protein ABBQ38_005809 [Trebouxia sp. C0009 RCD-2024]
MSVAADPRSSHLCFCPSACRSLGSSRTLEGPTQQPAQSTVAVYSQGHLWGPNHLSLGVWGWGQPGYQLVVRQASQRLRPLQAQKRGFK